MAWVTAALLFSFGCGADPATSSTTTGGSGGSGGGAGGGDSAAFKVRGSVEQIAVWKAPPGAKIEVRDAADKVVESGVADQLGSLIFRHVPAGDAYAVSAPDLVPAAVQKPIRVTTVASSLPGQDFYASQKIVSGYQYLTMRDGTKLAAFVTLPGKPSEGPYPTIVNYSGYDPGRPGQPLGDYKFLCAELPVICDAPSDASATIAAIMGYATVSVNMRGTGCSGGAYDFFEDLQLLDGYDIIETVAAQDWTLGHRVGMTGLSYPGISQLFVAKTHPPHLAAITPLSVIGGAESTLRPGGIFNDGFALSWITQVLNKAEPYGQGWEQKLVDAGDTVCEENQLLHGQKYDVIAEAKDTLYYTDERAAPLDPTAFAHEIDVPVFLSGAWEDEQTGPFFFTLLDQFKKAPIKRFTVFNGVHPDGFAPQVLVEWKAFLDIYVAHRVPVISEDIRTLAPQLFVDVFKSQLSFPPDRFAKYATWEEAKAAYEAEPSLRAIFEDGGTGHVGAPEGSFEMRFDAWPPASKALRLYLHEGGSLDEKAPTEVAAASSFQLDPEAGHRGILAPGANVWDPLPAYDWKQPASGAAVIGETAPLAADAVMLGSGSVDLWIRSPVSDADLEVNLSEVRPDGQERYIQSGWLRASLRKLAASATELWPEHTYREPDAAPLVPGAWTQARVGIAGFGHVFRAGSRIRVSIDTPGDSRAAWQFALLPFPGQVVYDIGHSATHATSVVLPVLPGVTATTPLPACPSLRAQQCRDHVPYVNTPALP